MSDSSSGSKRSGFNAFFHLREFKPQLHPSGDVLAAEPFGARLFLTLCHGVQDLAANVAAIKNSADHTI